MVSKVQDHPLGASFFRRLLLTTARNQEMKNLLTRLWKEEEGQDLVEYGLLLVLVALLSVTFISTIGTELSKIFNNAASTLTSVNT
jgi:pilus assembly protein Flp/PilA